MSRESRVYTISKYHPTAYSLQGRKVVQNVVFLPEKQKKIKIRQIQIVKQSTKLLAWTPKMSMSWKRKRKQNYFRLKKMKRMLNDTNHQRNANQNHNEILPLICQNGYHQKEHNQKNIGKNVETRKPLCTVHGNINWCSHHGKQYGAFSKKQK